MGTGQGLSTVSICGSVLPLLKPDEFKTSKLGREAAKRYRLWMDPDSGSGFRDTGLVQISSYWLAAVANYTENRSGRPI